MFSLILDFCSILLFRITTELFTDKDLFGAFALLALTSKAVPLSCLVWALYRLCKGGVFDECP